MTPTPRRPEDAPVDNESQTGNSPVVNRLSTPSRPEMESAVREACYRASVKPGFLDFSTFDPSLADVLMALGKKLDDAPANLGGFTRDLLNNGWHLPLPLSGQSDETVGYLYSLLAVH